MALMPTSPAIGAGITSDYPGTDTPITTDQRGYSRATMPDIGAYEVEPTVTGLSPAEGPVDGGTTVTITGAGFDSGSTVEFGSNPATDVTFVNPTTITAVSPAGSAVGVVDVTVTTSGITSSTSSADEFTYLSPMITISTSSLDLGTTTAGTAGTEQSYTIGGADLNANVTVTAPTGVEVSDDEGSTWNSSLALTESDGTVISTTIEARISAAAVAGSITGSISNTSTGATEQDVAVSGTVKVETPPGNIVPSIPQSYYGEDVTFTATFSASAAGSAPITGTVAFYDGTTYLGTAPLVDPPVSGTASLLVSSLAAGSHSITAVYSGDANYSSSTSPPVSFQVVQAVPGVSLTVSATSQRTLLTANVVVTSPGNPPIVGSVSFYESNVLVGTAPVSNSVATLTIAPLSPGAHAFQAIFTGGMNFSSSSSQEISPDGPQVTRLLRYGFHAQKTYLLLYFNGPLDPASAQDTANYTISGPNNQHGHSRQRIKVGLAIYDPSTHSVTLRSAARLNLHRRYTLTVNGTTPSGVTNPSGTVLDGVGTGLPGSNYATTITGKILAGRASKLPTTGLVDAARNQTATAKTSTQHVHAHSTLHAGAVDQLLERGLLRVPRHRARH
jgi:large repetitive protein